MIIARISTPKRPDRFVELEVGNRIFGSDLGCDVVLLEDSVQPSHFALDITPGGVFLEMIGAASGLFDSRHGEKGQLAAGRRVFWSASDELRIGAMTISLQGEECLARPPRHPTRVERVLYAAARHSRVALTTSMVIVVSVGVVASFGDILLRSITPVRAEASAPVNALPSLPLGFGVAAISAEPAAARPAPADPAEAAAAVEHLIREAGYEPFGLSPEKGAWTATFYVERAQDREALLEALKPLAVEPLIHVDRASKTEAQAILRNLNHDVDIRALTAGEIELVLKNGDAAGEEMIEGVLLSDIPSLRAVRFVSPALASIGGLRDEIAGVWMGVRPYITLRDGRDIRVGGEIAEGVILAAIETPTKLRLNVNGDQQEVNLE